MNELKGGVDCVDYKYQVVDLESSENIVHEDLVGRTLYYLEKLMDDGQDASAGQSVGNP